MVTGIESFKEWFKSSEEQYTIIGGTACDILMTEKSRFRELKRCKISSSRCLGLFWVEIKDMYVPEVVHYDFYLSHISQECYDIDIFLARRIKYAVN